MNWFIYKLMAVKGFDSKPRGLAHAHNFPYFKAISDLEFYYSTHSLLQITFCDFLQIFEKIRLKTLLNRNIPGLLHFFDIFCNRPGVSTVVYYSG